MSKKKALPLHVWQKLALEESGHVRAEISGDRVTLFGRIKSGETLSLPKNPEGDARKVTDAP